MSVSNPTCDLASLNANEGYWKVLETVYLLMCLTLHPVVALFSSEKSDVQAVWIALLPALAVAFINVTL